MGTGVQLFLQIACRLPQEELPIRRVSGLALSCITVIAALILMVTIDFIKKNFGLDFTSWDFKNITAGDYTVEFDITKEFYSAFWAQVGIHMPDDKSMADNFRQWLMQQMNLKLSLVPDLGFHHEPLKNVEIALTWFAYSNKEVLELLSLRGDAIKSENWAKVHKINAQLNQVKETKFSDITRPCTVFMTFENEESYERALSLNEMGSFASEQPPID